MSIKTTNELRVTLLNLEKKLLTPAIRRNAKAASALLDDDFYEIGKSGKTFSKEQILRLMADEDSTEISWTIDDFEIRRLAPTIILVTYKIRENASLRSSVWRNDDKEWKMVFHQGTPSPEESAT
ncbi:MAG: DUF4440 domain-containing protein [Pseudomonadota bacterium]